MAIREITKEEFLKGLVDDVQENHSTVRQKSKPATLTNKRLCTAMYIENHIYAGNPLEAIYTNLFGMNKQ